MAAFGSRGGFAEKFSLPLMVVAFVVVGGFLYWLSVTAKPTEVSLQEETTEEGPSASAILDVDDFLTDPGRYEGQVIEVTGARVASRLGTQAFWIGPDDRPFLVKMGAPLLADSTRVLIEQMLNITGTVRMMTDSVLTAWDSLGAFQNEGDRIVAEFAVGSPFIEAEKLVSRGGVDGGAAGAAGGSASGGL